jgi:hypothetical protein
MNSKNIHILPTDKPSKKGDIVVWNGLKIWDGIGKPPHHNQNIYITSDEKPNGEDWFIRDGYLHRRSNYTKYKEVDKKIILTTDPDLIKDGVQSIDDEFLEWFVKNPSCEEVELEREHDDSVPYPKMRFVKPFKIIIPQEKPKSSCPKCRTTDFDNCHSIHCPMRKEEPKQETL